MKTGTIILNILMEAPLWEPPSTILNYLFWRHNQVTSTVLTYNMWQLSCSLCDDIELAGISENSLYSCAVLHGISHHFLEIINRAEGGVVTGHTPCCIQQLQ